MVNARSHGQNLPLVDRSATAIPPRDRTCEGPDRYAFGDNRSSRSTHLLDLSPIVRASDARSAHLPANAATFRRYKFKRRTLPLSPMGAGERSMYRLLAGL